SRQLHSFPTRRSSDLRKQRVNERDARFAEIGRALREHNKFAVLSHVRPDGDALGSTLALTLSLKELGKDVRAWNEEGMLEKYGRSEEHTSELQSLAYL